MGLTIHFPPYRLGRSQRPGRFFLYSDNRKIHLDPAKPHNMGRFGNRALNSSFLQKLRSFLYAHFCAFSTFSDARFFRLGFHSTLFPVPDH